eukprot:gnl/MRDRNA2_/MRDRNA2_47991_c0_seq1.p1 gnl/MRDRNA2_/MRDRNA2_47991_c0~~gnl/MRDRNA2_/MRDRNA2_47991_c0_seq1.p1  ORF type:complete len:186 (+),score=21.41 gnl/MRDRNA2_/MRDRNA2_47991_c0_seq1:49-558(+)
MLQDVTHPSQTFEIDESDRRSLRSGTSFQQALNPASRGCGFCCGCWALLRGPAEDVVVNGVVHRTKRQVITCRLVLALSILGALVVCIILWPRDLHFDIENVMLLRTDFAVEPTFKMMTYIRVSNSNVFSACASGIFKDDACVGSGSSDTLTAKFGDIGKLQKLSQLGR